MSVHQAGAKIMLAEKSAGFCTGDSLYLAQIPPLTSPHLLRQFVSTASPHRLGLDSHTWNKVTLYQRVGTVQIEFSLAFQAESHVVLTCCRRKKSLV